MARFLNSKGDAVFNFIRDSKVININYSNRGTLFTLAELKALFNLTAIDPTKLICVVSNGDGSATDTPVIGTIWHDNAIKVNLGATYTGSIRINYILFLNP